MKTICIVIFVLAWGSVQCSSEGGFNITVLHTNDIHSRFLEANKKGGKCTDKDRNKDGCFGGVARLVTKVKEFKKNKNTFFFNGGDFFQGTVWYTVLKYNIVAEAMSRMMYDSVCLGNHEFDDGPEGLAPFLKKMEMANVTVLGTNIDTSEEPLLNGTQLKKSIIYTVENVNIGVMGVVTQETMQIARPGKIKILDEIKSIQEEVKVLKEKNVKFYVVISHVGFDKDMEIAKSIPELHLVVGGHTNTFLYNGTSPRPEDHVEGEYPSIAKREGGSYALVVQDYWAGKYLGHLQLQFDREGNLKTWSGNPILMDNKTEEDPDMVCMLEPYKEIVENASKEYIGISKVKLEASHKVCRIKECNSVNLITDAFLAFYADRNSTNGTEDWSDVNAAVVNSGIAKTTIEQGIIRREDMMALMPYESTLYVLTMNGAQLWSMFEYSISKFNWSGDPDGAFLQVSGIRVAYNFSLPKNCRVIKLDILCAKCRIPKYEPVLFNETYRIVTTSYIVNGGDGFKFDSDVKKETAGFVDNDVVINYVRKMSPIKEPEEGRVIMYNNPRPKWSRSGLPPDATTEMPKSSAAAL